ncbi:sensor histidine kinase [uncultured Demequina sp.]|uniref:sensor histidine kinase n=1 Tax=uncultured Demequina sp. TaxID=693499 RepID=UPI0025CDE471|nr:ATP-binding protein [uncultured Demequina sp.]
MSAPRREPAEARLRRVLYTACGIGALVFGALLLTGGSGILAQREVLAPWYWWASILTAIALPASLLALSGTVSVWLTRRVAQASVAGFLAIQVLWVPAMTVDVLPDGAEPWIQGITALSSTIAGVTWTTRWVWVFPALQGPMVTTVQILSSDTDVVDAVLDGVGALLFCSILTGVAQAVVRAGQAQDAAADSAREAAMAAASSSTRQREQARINGIVHDDIMSVLLAASREELDPDLPVRASSALASVRAIASPVGTSASVVTADLVEATLRGTVADCATGAAISVDSEPDCSVPRVVVTAVAEAMGEALRNVERHAGEGVRATVSARIASDAVEVVVADAGRGFDPAEVKATRLGIQASINGRMDALPGGSSRVWSQPGAGTRVTIGWRR